MTFVVVAILVVALVVAIGGWRHAYVANRRMRVITLREVLRTWEACAFNNDDRGDRDLYRWLREEIAAADTLRVSKVERVNNRQQPP